MSVVRAFFPISLRRRSPILNSLAGLLSISAAAMGLIGEAKAASAPSFSSVASVHDPSVVKDGDTFYVFGSHLASAKSTDLMNWTQLTSAVVTGNQLMPNVFTDYADVFTWSISSDFWAPDVIKLADGNYRYYYCSCQGTTSRSALGLSVGTTVMGPYVNQGIMLKSGMWGLLSPDGTVYDNAKHPNVVDPSVFWDQSGVLWMVYGSYSGGIFLMKLDPSTGWIQSGQGYGKCVLGGNNARIEGPYITYSPETGYYYLFVTFGGLDASGGYNIRVSRSANPNGPFYDYAGNDMANVKGATGTYFDDASIAPYGVKLMGNCEFLHVDGDVGTAAHGYVSPGGTSIYHDAARGRYIMVIHSRFVGTSEYHEVRTFQLWLNEDGWFVCAPQRYAGEALQTTDVAYVPGQYKLINHGKDITATVKTSTVITLNANGSITGASTGTWAFSGDHYATLVIDGTTYKGVFAQNWDDDNKVWVRTFTALSGTGVAVWGSKVSASTTDSTPTISTQPSSQSVSANKSVTFSVVASGSPSPAYQWKKEGVNISGATSSTYTISKVASTDAGNYSCVVGNRVAAYFSDAAVLTVTAAVGPTITTQPSSVSTSAGASATLSAGASGTGLTYQWRKYDDTGTAVVLTGATSATLTLSGITSEEAGTYDCVITDSSGSSITNKATIAVSISTTSNSAARLTNLSARANVQTGVQSTIVGFVISGSGSEKVLIRGNGPSLYDTFSLSGYLADPTMSLFNQSDTSTAIATNDDWSTTTGVDLASIFSSVGAFAWKTGSKDSALYKTLDAGAYTAMVNGKTGNGVGLVEIYEQSASGTRLVNLSARGVVSTGGDSLIGGFVIGGTGLKTVLIRVSGPAMAQWLSQYVADPVLKLYDQANVSSAIQVNDDWDSDSTQGDVIAATASKLGAFAWTRGSKDAALLVTLRPGAYTAMASSKTADTSLIGLLEVYEVNP